MKNLLLLCALLAPYSAIARPGFLNVFNTEYGTSPNLQGQSCAICHANSNGGLPFNSYGWDVRQRYRSNGFNMLAALLAVEDRNSDRDPTGATNIQEIEADAAPGWTDGANNTFWFSATQTSRRNNPPANFDFVLDAGAVDRFAEYMAQFFPGVDDPEIVGPNADPNGDGITNVVAYFVGTDPREESPANTPAISFQDGEVIITHQTNPDAVGITGQLVFREGDSSDFLPIGQFANRIFLRVEGNATPEGYNLNTYTIPQPEGVLLARLEVFQNL